MARWDELISRVPQDRPIVGAEIGVWRGDMAYKLLKRLQNLTLYLVDRWEAPPPDDSFYSLPTQISRLPDECFKQALTVTKQKVCRYRNRVRVLQGHSVEMAGRVEDGSLDFAFIDADHTYEGCLADIRAWYPKVRPGGLIGGHDYGRDDKGDVTGAVHGFFDPPGLPVEVSDFNCWWVRMPSTN